MSEQPGRLGLAIPTVDDDFAPSGQLVATAHLIVDIQRLHLEADKNAPDLRMVVQADDGLALELAHHLRHALVLREREVDAIALGFPIGRIQIKQRVRPVIAPDALRPVKVLDIGIGEAQMGGRQALLQPQEIQAWRRGGGGAERLPRHLPTETGLLQVVEARGALDVGQRLRPGVLEPLKYRATGERPFELPHKLLQVVLYHAVEIDQLAVDVIDDLDRRRRPHEEQGGAAGEHLHIALMRREAGKQGISQAALAADPGDDGCCHCGEPFTFWYDSPAS